MKQNKGYLGVFVLLIIAALLIAGCTQKNDTTLAGTDVPSAKPVVKIGVQLPLSGDLAFIGQSDQKAALLALAEVQKRDTKYTYELVFEDDQFNAKLASAAALKLISVDKVDALISVGSTAGNAVSPIANENNIIHFAIASDQNIAKGKYNYLHFTRPEEEAHKLVAEVSKRGYKRIALIVQNQEGTIAEENVLKELVKGTPISLVSIEHYNADEKDFKTIILKTQESKPDVILIAAFSPSFELIMKQLNDADVTIPITAVESPEQSSYPEVFEGRWYIMAAQPNDAFINAFAAAYNDTPKIAAPNTYDNVNMIVYGFEHADSTPDTKPTAAQVAAALATVKDFPGALGALTINEDGVVISQASVKTIKNGKPVVLTE